MKSKQGQIQVTFNWVYILIAGSLILLFFVGIVVKSKQSSEEKLAIDVVEIMGSIFTGAGVSEKTRNLIDTSGLIDYTFYFGCNEGVGEYGIVDNPARIENSITPVFAPKQIKTTKFITWSLPYRMPFKVIDLLFVTSTNTKYVVLGTNEFSEEFLKNTQEDFTVVNTLQDFDAGDNYQARVIDTDGSNVVDGQQVEPEELRNMDRVTAVQFDSPGQDARVSYYKKDKSGAWKLLSKDPVPIVGIDDEKNAAKFAAVFAENQDTYWCNMQKAFKRLSLLTDMYQSKSAFVRDYYIDRQTQGHQVSNCLGFINGRTDNIEDSLDSLETWTNLCLDSKSCLELAQTAQSLREVNNDMSLNCIPLY